MAEGNVTPSYFVSLLGMTWDQQVTMEQDVAAGRTIWRVQPRKVVHSALARAGVHTPPASSMTTLAMLQQQSRSPTAERPQHLPMTLEMQYFLIVMMSGEPLGRDGAMHVIKCVKVTGE
jgi:hypothetical protein